MQSTQVPRSQCIAFTKYNRRCLHMTNQGTMCHQHLKKDQGTRVAPSNIQGAKMGLFATREFKKGAQVATFSGARKHTTQNIKGDYVLKIDRDKYIDAKSPNTDVGRYVNESLSGDPGRNNSEFVYDTRNKIAGLKALEKIKAGKEIMADYGKNFWRDRANKFITSRKLRIRAPVPPPVQTRAAPAPAPARVQIVPRRTSVGLRSNQSDVPAKQARIIPIPIVPRRLPAKQPRIIPIPISTR